MGKMITHNLPQLKWRVAGRVKTRDHTGAQLIREPNQIELVQKPSSRSLRKRPGSGYLRN